MSTAPPTPWRAVALAAVGLWLVTLAWVHGPRLAADRSAPVELGPTAASPPTAPPDELRLRPSGFDRLPGWGDDPLDGVATALGRSCRSWLGRPAGETVRIADREIAVGRWQAACRALAAAPSDQPAAVRAVLENAFAPWAARQGDRFRGLFTGYYEPLLHGSRQRSERYRYPLHTRPPDLVSIDLGPFRPEWKGIRIGGRFAGGTFVPYHDRSAIEAGAHGGRGLELVWVDDAVDAFFLHIQGSGRIALAEGGMLRVGYAAQNGHPYVAIGKVLVEMGELERGKVSMQSIRRWLAEHPEGAAEVMRRNPSYVYFRRLEGDATDGPLGSQGVPLVPWRSLAVDRKFVPLGTPLWLDGRLPGAADGDPDRVLRRLLVAQDTGGAIRGPLRGDLFFGFGAEAAELAGRMRHPGRLWLLLPR